MTIIKKSGVFLNANVNKWLLCLRPLGDLTIILGIQNNIKQMNQAYKDPYVSATPIFEDFSHVLSCPYLNITVHIFI